MATPKPVTTPGPINSTAQEFARAEQLSREILMPEDLQAWGIGCFYGQYDEYCLEVDENGRACILSAETQKPVIAEFELDEDFYIAAADMDNNGAEEIYVENGGEYIKFDLKDRIDFSREWMRLPPTSVPYDRDRLWGGGCHGTDWVKPVQPFRLYVGNGALHITGTSEIGAEHYIVTPTVSLEKSEDGRLYDLWDRERVVPILECALDIAAPPQPDWYRLGSAIQMFEKSQGLLELQDGQFELRGVSISFRYEGSAIEIDPICADGRKIATLRFNSIYDLSLFFTINRAGVMFRVGSSINMDPLNAEQKKFAKAALNFYLEHEGAMPQNSDRAHNARIILKALGNPPPAWAR